MENWEDRFEKTHPVLDGIVKFTLGIMMVGLTVAAAVLFAAIRGAL